MEDPLLFLTIPTRGDDPGALADLVRESGVAGDRIIIVRTDPRVTTPDNVRVIDDFADINIHRWWNAGIQYAQALGASSVAVLNDDVRIASGSLDQLHAALHETGATIATPGKRLAIHKRSMHPDRFLVGSIWVINPLHGLRPSEDFRWFYGDDDLDIRARVKFSGIVTVPTDFEHLRPGQTTDSSTRLQALVREDERLFFHRHPARFVYRKLWQRTQGRAGKTVRTLFAP